MVLRGRAARAEAHGGAPQPLTTPPELSILHDAEGLVVVDKPSGLPSTGRSLDDPECVQSVVMRQLRRRRIWAVHQLDKDTTGINLFVRRKALVAVVAEQLRAGQKHYLALCHGVLRGGPVVVDAPIGRGLRADGRSFPALRRDGRPARSTVVPRGVSSDGAASLVEVRLHTGRTHQARLHLASLGHPVLGERVHCEPPSDAFPRQALHAWRVELRGAGGDVLRLEAPLPDDFSVAMRIMDLETPAF